MDKKRYEQTSRRRNEIFVEYVAKKKKKKKRDKIIKMKMLQ